MNNYRDAIDQFLTQQVGERLPAMIDTKERFTNASPGGKTFTAEDYIRSKFRGRITVDERVAFSTKHPRPNDSAGVFVENVRSYISAK